MQREYSSSTAGSILRANARSYLEFYENGFLKIPRFVLLGLIRTTLVMPGSNTTVIPDSGPESVID